MRKNKDRFLDLPRSADENYKKALGFSAR